MFQGVENLVYLDDSGSMRTTSRLSDGRQALKATLMLLNVAGPLRVLKFGSHKSLIVPRDSSSDHASSTANTSTSGKGTKWDFILPSILLVRTPIVWLLH